MTIFKVSTIIILIILLIIIYNLRVFNLKKLYQIHNYINIAKTGDIIFTRSDHLKKGKLINHLKKNILYSTVTSIFTHVGIIVVIKDIPYIFSADTNDSILVEDDCPLGLISPLASTSARNEGLDSLRKIKISAPQPYNKSDGTNLILLDEYIKNYCGNLVIFRIIDEDISNKHLLNYVKNSLDQIFKHNILTFIKIIFRMDGNYNDNETICVKTVIEALHCLNILNDINPNNSNVNSLYYDVLSSDKFIGPYFIK